MGAAVVIGPSGDDTLSTEPQPGVICKVKSGFGLVAGLCTTPRRMKLRCEPVYGEYGVAALYLKWQAHHWAWASICSYKSCGILRAKLTV